MPKRIEKREDHRIFSFRMPRSTFDLLADVAQARGVDVSGMLNWILADYMPFLLEKKAEYEASLLTAAKKALEERGGGEAKGKIGAVRDLLERLQELYQKMTTPPGKAVRTDASPDVDQQEEDNQPGGIRRRRAG
jgi:hypothetical protein